MRYALALFLPLAASSLAWAECAPEKMVKIVHRDATPGIDPQSFAAMPKTLYRLGSKYGRTEEALDSALGIHGLLVTNEPDSWMVNLVTKAGQHLVDTGAPYHFHAPIVGGPDDPPAIVQLEFGCELDYMKARTGGVSKRATVDGRDIDQYEMSVNKYRLVLSVSKEDGKPVAFSLQERGKLIYDMRYVE